MSAKERLTRLRALQALATQLQVALIEECDLTRKQVDEIERSISEGEDRCRAFENWDGNQPDTWLKAGKAWRRPTQDDCGKMVRVTMQLGGNPEKLPEAELLGFTREGEPIIKGTKGEGVCWAYAWIECYKSEPIDTEGKGYISVQVDGVEFGKSPVLVARKYFDMAKNFKGEPFASRKFRAFVNQFVKDIQDGLAKKPEQADLVIDEESFLKPEPGTVVEDKWEPQVGDWVKITKPESTSRYGNGYEWVEELDYLDGEVHEITRIVQCDTHRPGYQVREIDESAYCLDASWLSLAETPEPAKAPSCVTWYREPTHADLANGPIDVEVCDAQTGDDHWEPRKLLAILPANIWHRYVTVSPYDTESSQTWRFARIKVEG